MLGCRAGSVYVQQVQGMTAETVPVCEHHWVETHQSDFPPAIRWVRQCSQCDRIDGGDLTEQLAPLAAEVAKLREKVQPVRDAWAIRAALTRATPAPTGRTSPDHG
jgi:hypothetical protein